MPGVNHLTALPTFVTLIYCHEPPRQCRARAQTAIVGDEGRVEYGGRLDLAQNRKENRDMESPYMFVHVNYMYWQETGDSTYLVKGMSQWVPQWIKKNWIGAGKKPVMNRDLWETLIELSRPHEIEWQWIRGHAGHKENERCDRLARAAIIKCLEEAATGEKGH